MFEIWYLNAGGDHFACHWSGGRGSLSAAEGLARFPRLADWLCHPIPLGCHSEPVTEIV